MSIRFSKTELLNITGGQSQEAQNHGSGSAKLSFHGLEYDSREIRGGELFVALKGKKQHGHSFLSSAFDRGAALFLVDDPTLVSSFPEPERVIVVKDTLRAFEQIAHAWRKSLSLPIIAVTGSVGKTTVKEMIAAILLKDSRGTYSLNSQNNHIGVAYTLCRLDPEHCWAVIELAASQPGQMSIFSKMVEPDVALITNIAPAHLDTFSSLDQICAEQFEITYGLKDGATLIVNGEDQTILRHLSSSKPKNLVKSFGQNSSTDLEVDQIESLGLEGICFRLRTAQKAYSMTMSSLGTHTALNGAAAALAARVLMPNISDETIIAALTPFKSPPRRLARHPLKGGRTLIDDSYEASPESMGASLNLASELGALGSRVGLILGDMLELGDSAAKFHEEAALKAAMAKPVFVIGVGQFAQLFRQAAAAQGIAAFVAESALAAAHLARKIEFDVVLVKGSNGGGLCAAAQLILERDGVLFDQSGNFKS